MLAFVLVLLLPLASEPLNKLDDGLDVPDRLYPIFVRMEDQLFRDAGDYEKFCKDNEQIVRLEVRKTVLDALRKKSAASWKGIAGTIARMEQSGAIRHVTRYWLVNGFACQATGKACGDLAEMDSVSFVYRQRLRNIPLHQSPKRGRINGERFKQVYESVIKQWKDDSNDPLELDGVTIPWNVKRVRAPEAWKQEKATGKGIVIALMDSGLMVAPSLMRGVWKNPDEKLNGKDDDGNGYIDDLFGYDFGRDHWYALGDGQRKTHGSACAGIMIGRSNNKLKLATGIAPRARVMVLRGMGYLKAYEYALVEGADILSMSFMWPGVPLGHFRGLCRLAHEHMDAAGIVAVGGAGNFGPGAKRAAQPAGKQIALPKDIPCVIAAAGIIQNGSKPGFSSEGPCYWEDVKFYNDYTKEKPLHKPDVTGCIGGYPVWGRPQMAKLAPRRMKLISDEGNSFGLIQGPQGNSFSGPHAAGVAALMLSVNPGLHPWQVKVLMEKTCKDLGKPGRDTQYGAGLLDALEAVRAAKRESAN